MENQDLAAGPPGRRGPWAVGRGPPGFRAAEPLGRWAADLLLAKPVLECRNFLSYRFPSPDGKVLGQMSRVQVCWLNCSLSPRKPARCYLKLSIPCFVLSSVTEMRALYLSIDFSSPLRYMLMTAFTS